LVQRNGKGVVVNDETCYLDKDGKGFADGKEDENSQVVCVKFLEVSSEEIEEEETGVLVREKRVGCVRRSRRCRSRRRVENGVGGRVRRIRGSRFRAEKGVAGESQVLCPGEDKENYCDGEGDCVLHPEWCECPEAQSLCSALEVKTLELGVNIDVSYGEKGSEDCPEGFEGIEDADACEKILNLVQKNGEGVVTDDEMCYIDKDGKGFADGKQDEKSQVVCMKFLEQSSQESSQETAVRAFVNSLHDASLWEMITVTLLTLNFFFLVYLIFCKNKPKNAAREPLINRKSYTEVGKN